MKTKTRRKVGRPLNPHKLVPVTGRVKVETKQQIAVYAERTGLVSESAAVRNLVNIGLRESRE